MSEEQEEYIAVLKASYGYAPQSEDEIEIKEDQLLLLIEKIDDECVLLSPLLDAWLTICSWWKVKPKGDSDGQGGLVPSAYVELVSAHRTETPLTVTYPRCYGVLISPLSGTGRTLLYCEGTI